MVSNAFEPLSFIDSRTENDLLLVTGQVVDAVIMPVAPHAAVIPGKYYHTGMSSTQPLVLFY